MFRGLQPTTAAGTIDTNGQPAVLDRHRGGRKEFSGGIVRLSNIFRLVAKSSISAVEDKTRNSGSRN